MKIKQLILVFFVSYFACGQKVPDYYNSINFKLKGDELKNELHKLITNTNSTQLSYGQLWSVLKQSDTDPENNANVLLVYGNTTSGIHARSRNKNKNGGKNGDWNREHVYPKSLGTPNLGTSGPGADAHHIRPADVSLNGQRGSKKFTDGMGDEARNSNGGWFPGNEWKGDVARMVMYMYIRYENRCRLTNVALGPVTYNNDIPDVLIKWNIEDPVSDYERNRNNVVQEKQGNRNPFIDNPYLATLIWGGPKAENTWPDAFSENPGTGDDKEPPSSPKNIKEGDITKTSFTISWEKSSDNIGVTDYEIYLNNKLELITKTNKATFTGLKPSTKYSIYIIAKDAANNKSVKSNILSITTLSGNKIINETGEAYTIYPNPINSSKKNKVFFDGKNLKEIKWLKIFNLSGQLIKEIINPFIHGNNEIDLPLENGIFILKTPQFSKKLIIQ